MFQLSNCVFRGVAYFLPDFFLVFFKKSLLSDLIPASGDFSGNNQLGPRSSRKNCHA